MLVRQGLIIKFTDEDGNTVVLRTSEVAGMFQDEKCKIHILDKSGFQYVLTPNEYITFDDVVTKIFF